MTNLILSLLLYSKKQTINPKYIDHFLSNDWVGNRQSHVKPDVLLVYLDR
ncbi:hypothetical protein PRO82_001449 [Candidatus Protochlamydia amoebophila]|nr:hypothetical protein [Candidatus Protochlamydia amoebophila]